MRESAFRGSIPGAAALWSPCRDVAVCCSMDRFLQGPDTNPKTVLRIREAINKEEDVTVQLLNYTKSGMPPPAQHRVPYGSHKLWS